VSSFRKATKAIILKFQKSVSWFDYEIDLCPFLGWDGGWGRGVGYLSCSWKSKKAKLPVKIPK
jgi:hypothetical protein